MIRLISGVYGGKNGLKRPGDGAFSLPADEEARLVACKVAVYVNAPIADSENDYVSDGAPIGFDEIPPEDFDEAEVVEEPIDLESLSAKDLRTIGAEYGLTFKANAKKVDMIEAITAAQAALANDGEDAPSFDAAEAVE